MILILAGRPLRSVQEDLYRNGAEFNDSRRMTGIWRGTQFEIYVAQKSYDAHKLCGRVFSEFLTFGICHPECISYAITRVDRHGSSHTNAFSR